MELPVCGEPLWPDTHREKNNGGWRRESGHGGPIHPSHRTFAGDLVVRIGVSHGHWTPVYIRLCARHFGVPGVPNTSLLSRSVCPAREWDQAMPTWYFWLMTYCEAFGSWSTVRLSATRLPIWSLICNVRVLGMKIQKFLFQVLNIVWFLWPTCKTFAGNFLAVFEPLGGDCT